VILRIVLAVLVFVGGNSFSIWLQNQNVSNWVLALTWSASFIGAALIAWWPRWKAAANAFTGRSALPTALPSWQRPWSDSMQVVSGHDYENQQVRLDGYEYQRCSFRNVTFLYDGYGPYGLVECKVAGTAGMLTENKGIQYSDRLTLMLKTFSVEVMYGYKDPVTGRVDTHATETKRVVRDTTGGKPN
jgi:hypothetical protein